MDDPQVNEKKFLDFLGRSEGADYNTIVGGKKFQDFATHPSTIGLRTKDGPSTAAGRYQITKTTYDSIASSLGVTDFSPESQDKIALGLLKRRGALDDVRSGNFEGAINKLGSEWVSLPSSTNPNQPKRSWDWARGVLGDSSLGQGSPLPNSVTSAKTFGDTTPRPSAFSLFAEERQRDARNNFVRDLPAATVETFKATNSIYNYFQTKATAVADGTPVDWSSKEAQERLKGVAPEHWDYILQAKTNEEAAGRLNRQREVQDSLDRLGQLGTATKLVGGVAGALPDIPTLLGFVPGIGTASAATRIGNAVRMGLAGGASTLAYDAMTHQYKPLGTTDDLYMSAAMGLATGASAGLLLNPKYAKMAAENRALADNARRAAGAANLEELKLSGLNVTADGERLMHTAYSDEELGAAGVTRGFSEGDLQGIGKDPTRIQSGLNSLDSDQVSIGDLKRLKGLSQAYHPMVINARNAIREAFGSDIAEGLERSGRVKLIAEQRDLPRKLRKEEGVNAFYDPQTDTTFLMADRLDKNNVRGVIMHDVGVHQGLERVVGTDVYNRMVAEVGNLAGKGDAAAQSALSKAAKSSTADFIRNEEKLAYYLEHVGSNVQGVFREALANIKAFLVKRFGFDIGFNEKDLIALVQGSVRKVATDRKFGSYNQGAKVVWHGGPVKGIDRLSTDFVGTGEGDVVKGWGLYTSSSKFVANHYRTKESLFRGKEAEDGGLYQLRTKDSVHPTKFLQWDDASQSKQVQEALQKAGIESEGKTGRDIYFALMAKAEGATALEKGKAVSQYLDSLGIIGNEYKSANTKRNPNPTSNYVFYSDRHLDIAVRYSVGDGLVEQPHITGGGLSYESKLLHAETPVPIRSLSSKLIPATGGYSKNEVIKVTASEDAQAWTASAITRTRKEWMPERDSWMKEQGFKPWQTHEATDAFADKVHSYVLGFEEQFEPQVIKAGEVLRKELAAWTEHTNNPLKDVGGQKRGLTESVIVDAETGAEKIVGTLEKDPNYLPRKHDPLKWADVYGSVENGREKVIAWWAGARRSVDPENITEEAAARFGKRYVTVIEAAHGNRAQDLLDDLVKGQNKASLLDYLTNMKDASGNNKFTAREAFEATEDLIPRAPTDAGALNFSLKHRNTINEKYKETWTLKNGEQSDVNMKNFVHTNVFDSTEAYYKRMGGAIALAKHADIYKSGDILTAIEKATHNEFGGLPSAKVDDYRKLLGEVFDHIQGIPREDWAWWKKGLSMMNTYNVLRLGGGFVWNQTAEMGQITGTMGLKNTLRAVSELESLTRDLKTGKAPHDYLQYLENTIGGSGAEYIERVQFKANDDWVRHLGDTSKNRTLDKIDNISKQAATGALAYTGMTPMMIQQKRVHGVALMNHFVDAAHGLEKGFLNKERLAWMGMTEEEFGTLKEAIKNYSKPAKGEYSTFQKLDIDKFAKEVPELESKLRMAIFRESRRAIQENDLASSVPLMGTTLGQTVFQFMNFGMNAWDKQMKFAWNHKDMSTFNTILHSSLLAYLAYTGRTYAQSIGLEPDKRQKFLDERLDTKQVVANSFGRLSQLSLLPNVYDSLPFTPPMFSGMRTTSDVSGLASLPTMQFANDFVKASKKLGRNAASGETETTAKDIKALSRLTPLNNVWPISTFWNAVSNDFPDKPK